MGFHASTSSGVGDISALAFLCLRVFVTGSMIMRQQLGLQTTAAESRCLTGAQGKKEPFDI